MGSELTLGDVERFLNGWITAHGKDDELKQRIFVPLDSGKPGAGTGC